MKNIDLFITEFVCLAVMIIGIVGSIILSNVNTNSVSKESSTIDKEVTAPVKKIYRVVVKNKSIVSFENLEDAKKALSIIWLSSEGGEMSANEIDKLLDNLEKHLKVDDNTYIAIDNLYYNYEYSDFEEDIYR